MKLAKPGFLILLFIPLLLGCGYIPRIAAMMNDPLTAEEHNNLGVAYEKEGRYELALREYERAADKDEGLITPIVNMGNVHLKLQRYDEAERLYLEALEKDEKNIDAANNLASLYIILNRNYDKGLRYLTKAIFPAGELSKPMPDDTPAYALDTIGVLFFRLGNTDRAKEMLEEACKKAGNDKVLLEEITLHLKEIGEEGCGSETGVRSGFYTSALSLNCFRQPFSIAVPISGS